MTDVSKESSFSFLVIAYNHEDYILEHLESIKFLIKKYAQDIDVDIIINDDKSTDGTVELIDRWLSYNKNIFNSIVKIYNKRNLGTCHSILNMLSHVSTDYAKLTAGDDVYSYENIFSLEDSLKIGPIVSGFPLDLTNGIISEKKFDIKMIISSYYIYKNKDLIERFKWPSNNNAPNIIYDLNFLNNSKLLNYLRSFDVVEDWPIQISIANQKKSGKFILEDKVFTYYRRTLGSTYIVANERFSKDQLKIYKDLIDSEKRFIKKILLKNRRYCFSIENRFLKKILNVSIYRYVVLYILQYRKTQKHYLRFKSKLNIEAHRKHYKEIACSAKDVEIFIKNNYID